MTLIGSPYLENVASRLPRGLGKLRKDPRTVENHLANTYRRPDEIPRDSAECAETETAFLPKVLMYARKGTFAEIVI